MPPGQAFGTIPTFIPMVVQNSGAHNISVVAHSRLGIPINSTVPHWLGSKNVMTAADVMYIYYELPTDPLPVVPIATLSLCLSVGQGALQPQNLGQCQRIFYASNGWVDG